MRHIPPLPEIIQEMLEICRKAKTEGKRVVIRYNAPHLNKFGNTSNACIAGGHDGGLVHSINEHVMQVNILDSQGNLESVPLEMVVEIISVIEPKKVSDT